MLKETKILKPIYAQSMRAYETQTWVDLLSYYSFGGSICLTLFFRNRRINNAFPCGFACNISTTF